ncbi:MAG: hydroxylamine reductase, partial [Bacteroidetes bacterium]|nr:hydroxylamine reductase [Bacteroidota bacterium]
MSMFCYQCEETAKGIGCTIKGVCGKSDDVANLQDLLIFVLKGISIYSTKARELGIEDKEVNKFVFDSLFTTITNANFDKKVFFLRVKQGLALREKIKKEFLNAGGKIEEQLHESATWFSESETEFEEKAKSVGILSTLDEDIRSLRHLVLFGIKGMAAYAEHAFNLGYEDKSLWEFMQRALVATTNDTLTVAELISLVMETGANGVKVMALLDKANTTTYGNPEVTKVNIGVRNKPGILISGHDLKDMEELLKQTEGTGVDVYSHSEMLPAHYYPAFNKYEHFVGNYGNAWWKQREEFETFNGPILFTTNCLVPPHVYSKYRDKVYTTGAVGFEGMKYIKERPEGGKKDFSEIIELAKKCPPPTGIETGEIVGGFAHAQVFALADKVVEAVKSGAIKKFFVMAGCDGRMKERDYYTKFAENLPKDTIILTAG